LPFTQPDRLVTTRGSLADLRDLKEGSQTFEDLAFWASNQFNLRLDADSRQVLGGQVTPNLFSLLGVQPAACRAGFSRSDDRRTRSSWAIRCGSRDSAATRPCSDAAWS
jgi:hypothetical protein